MPFGSVSDATTSSEGGNSAHHPIGVGRPASIATQRSVVTVATPGSLPSFRTAPSQPAWSHMPGAARARCQRSHLFGGGGAGVRSAATRTARTRVRRLRSTDDGAHLGNRAGVGRGGQLGTCSTRPSGPCFGRGLRVRQRARGACSMSGGSCSRAARQMRRGLAAHRRCFLADVAHPHLRARVAARLAWWRRQQSMAHGSSRMCRTSVPAVATPPAHPKGTNPPALCDRMARQAASRVSGRERKGMRGRHR